MAASQNSESSAAFLWSSPNEKSTSPPAPAPGSTPLPSTTSSSSSSSSSSPPAAPIPLTLCTNPTTLKRFLATARYIDDTLTTQLNTLSLPPTDNSRSSSSSSYSPTRALPSTRIVPASTCQSFLNSTLLPSWHQRTAALHFCESVYNSEIAKVEQKKEEVEKKVVDERLDPYSGREDLRPSVWVEQLGGVLRVERGVERVVRERTRGIVAERCGLGVEE